MKLFHILYWAPLRNYPFIGYSRYFLHEKDKITSNISLTFESLSSDYSMAISVLIFLNIIREEKKLN